MDMTLYQLFDLQQSVVSNLISQTGVIIGVFTIYLSVVFAYIVTAYAAGKNLTRTQVGIVSGVYVVTASVFAIALLGQVDTAVSMGSGYWKLEASIQAAQGLPSSQVEPVSVIEKIVRYGGRLVLLAGIFVPLYFMGTVRALDRE